MQIAEPVMKLYTEATDGSSIERKESALVWQYRDADLGFGSSQAKEMLDHLESVLANEPVAAKSGQFIVEVKPQVYIVSLNDFLQKRRGLFFLQLIYMKIFFQECILELISNFHTLKRSLGSKS